MLQEAPFDLTKFLSPERLGFAALCVYVTYDRIQRWRRSDSTVRAGEIGSAVAPHKERADNAEHLAQTRKEQRDDAERELAECEKRLARKSELLGEETEAKDRLQFKLMEMQGRLDSVEGRLVRLEGDKGRR